MVRETMSRAIVTMATNDAHKSILAETMNMMKQYAGKCDADFICVTSDAPGFPIPHYRKLEVIRDALQKYERIAWIDCDVLISKNAPDIFEEVPEDSLGIFNEATWIDRSKDASEWAELTGFQLPTDTYYNTGVMVINANDIVMFAKPEVPINHYGEQTYLNMMFDICKPKIHKLSHHFNRMSCTHFQLGEEPFCSYFIHFAGMTADPNLPAFIKRTVEEWAKKNWTGDKTIGVVCNNGMGNQIATVPVIQYLAKTHPDHKIVVQSPFPEVFKHLESNQIEVIDEKGTFKSKFTLMKSTALLGSIQDVLAHPTDFHSISLLQRQLPIEDRTITVPKAKLKEKLPSDTIVIHAGKSGWASKEMPEIIWQEVSDKLRSKGFPVAIIGAKDFKKKNRDGSAFWGCFTLKNVDYDFTDCDYATTCEVINQSAFLLSNDSMPIHAAGATLNPWIGLITIAKRPEFILPYRLGRQDYKSISWTGTPLWEVVKEPVVHSPDNLFSWAEMHSGMQWPSSTDIVDGIVSCMNKVIPNYISPAPNKNQFNAGSIR